MPLTLSGHPGPFEGDGRRRRILVGRQSDTPRIDDHLFTSGCRPRNMTVRTQHQATRHGAHALGYFSSARPRQRLSLDIFQ